MLKQSSAGAVPVSVVVRIRAPAPVAAPAATADDSNGDRVVVDSDGQTLRCIDRSGNGSGSPYTFDAVYGSTSTTTELFATEVAPRVKQCVLGYNTAIVLFGQADSGKSYTLFGSSHTAPAPQPTAPAAAAPGSGKSKPPATGADPAPAAAASVDESGGGGIASLTADTLFALLNQRVATHAMRQAQTYDNRQMTFSVSIQAVEIFNDSYHDLLTHPSAVPHAHATPSAQPRQSLSQSQAPADGQPLTIAIHPATARAADGTALASGRRDHKHTDATNSATPNDAVASGDPTAAPASDGSAPATSADGTAPPAAAPKPAASASGLSGAYARDGIVIAGLTRRAVTDTDALNSVFRSIRRDNHRCILHAGATNRDGTKDSIDGVCSTFVWIEIEQTNVPPAFQTVRSRLTLILLPSTDTLSRDIHSLREQPIAREILGVAGLLQQFAERKEIRDYSESKTSQLLEDVWGGAACSTLVVCTIHTRDVYHTRITLEYGQVVSQLTNYPLKSEPVFDALLKAYRDRVVNLRRHLRLISLDDRAAVGAAGAAAVHRATEAENRDRLIESLRERKTAADIAIARTTADTQVIVERFKRARDAYATEIDAHSKVQSQLVASSEERIRTEAAVVKLHTETGALKVASRRDVLELDAKVNSVHESKLAVKAAASSQGARTQALVSAIEAETAAYAELRSEYDALKTNFRAVNADLRVATDRGSVLSTQLLTHVNRRQVIDGRCAAANRLITQYKKEIGTAPAPAANSDAEAAAADAAVTTNPSAIGLDLATVGYRYDMVERQYKRLHGEYQLFLSSQSDSTVVGRLNRHLQSLSDQRMRWQTANETVRKNSVRADIVSRMKADFEFKRAELQQTLEVLEEAVGGARAKAVAISSKNPVRSIHMQLREFQTSVLRRLEAERAHLHTRVTAAEEELEQFRAYFRAAMNAYQSSKLASHTESQYWRKWCQHNGWAKPDTPPPPADEEKKSIAIPDEKSAAAAAFAAAPSPGAGAAVAGGDASTYYTLLIRHHTHSSQRPLSYIAKPPSEIAASSASLHDRKAYYQRRLQGLTSSDSAATRMVVWNNFGVALLNAAPDWSEDERRASIVELEAKKRGAASSAPRPAGAAGQSADELPITWLERAAEAGSVIAAANVAVCIMHGVGGAPRDERRAVQILQKIVDSAAAASVATASSAAATALAAGANPFMSKRGGGGGSGSGGGAAIACALVNLSTAVLYGKGGSPRDGARAVALLERACSTECGSYAPAINKLGILLIRGLTVREKAKAPAAPASVALSSAITITPPVEDVISPPFSPVASPDNHSPPALDEKGVFAAGIDAAEAAAAAAAPKRTVLVPRNESSGWKWLTLAAYTHGYDRAIFNLAHLYAVATHATQQLAESHSAPGAGGELSPRTLAVRNEQKAFELYTKAAGMGLADAQTNLALLYLSGRPRINLPKDEQKAVALLRAGAAQHFARAHFHLSLLYESGRLSSSASGDVVASGDVKGGGDHEEAVLCLERAARNGYGSAQLNLALMYLHGKGGLARNPARAAVLLTAAAHLGLARSQFNLGVMLEHGDGVPVNTKQALYWYERAAEKGLPEAQFVLGECYGKGAGPDGPDPQRAVYWVRKAASAGHVEAQVILAHCYATGEGVDRSEKEAFEWYLKAATPQPVTAAVAAATAASAAGSSRASTVSPLTSNPSGNADAQHHVALAYQTGLPGGVLSPDPYKAAEYFELAAKQNHAEAQCSLAVMYMNGVTVTASAGVDPNRFAKNEKRAFEWFVRSSANGCVDALYNTAICFANGLGVSADARQEFEYYRKAAEKGLTKAMFNVGVCYERGEGTGVNFNEAFKWYTRCSEASSSTAAAAAAAGDGTAVIGTGERMPEVDLNLAFCYLMGRGTAKDEKKAFTLYERCAKEHNFPEAHFHLGSCYESGIGCTAAPRTAVKHYEKAANAGLTDAQFQLAVCCEHGIGRIKNRDLALSWLRKASDAGHEDATRMLAELKAAINGTAGGSKSGSTLAVPKAKSKK